MGTTMKNPQTAFNLSENSNLVLEILFTPGKPTNHEDWPLARKLYKEGKIKLSYANGDEQEINLQGVCLRPVLKLNRTGTEGVKGLPV